MKPFACCAMILLLSTSAAAQNVARLTVPRDTLLTDERIPIALTGVKPGELVTIRLAGVNGRQRSSATFIADRNGTVDLERSYAIAGSYSGVDGMGLFWSIRRQPGVEGPAGRPPAVSDWEISAEIDGVIVATDTVWRRAVAPDVRITRIREKGVTGVLYEPPGEGHPAIVVLAGSQGGTVGVNLWPGGLASRGYTVLALAYFNEDGLPKTLLNVPLEYFENAIHWLRSRPSVDPNRIGIQGGSKGAEAALLIAATYPKLIRAVAAHVPGSVVFPGCCDDASRQAPAWTLNGKPLAHMPFEFALVKAVDTFSIENRVRRSALYLHRLADTAAVRRAAIPVERIEAPILLVSAGDDGIWPSYYMAEQIMARLKQYNYSYPYHHIRYENSGHFITRPYIAIEVYDQAGNNDFGGTPVATQRAREQGWAELLNFFDRHLKR